MTKLYDTNFLGAFPESIPQSGVVPVFPDTIPQSGVVPAFPESIPQVGVVPAFSESIPQVGVVPVFPDTIPQSSVVPVFPESIPQSSVVPVFPESIPQVGVVPVNANTSQQSTDAMSKLYDTDFLGKLPQSNILGTTDFSTLGDPRGKINQGTILPNPYEDNSSAVPNELSVFGSNGNVKPGIDVNAIAPAPALKPQSEVVSALNQGVTVPDNRAAIAAADAARYQNQSGYIPFGIQQGKTPAPQFLVDAGTAIQTAFTPAWKQKQQAEQAALASTQQGADVAANTVMAPPILGAPSSIAAPSVQQGADVAANTVMAPTVSGAPSSIAAPSLKTLNIDGGSATVPSEFAGQTFGKTLADMQPMQPKTANDLIGYKPDYNGQNIADYTGYNTTPETRTEQFVDAQGRLRRRDAGTKALAPQYTEYEKQAAARDARLMGAPLQTTSSQAGNQSMTNGLLGGQGFGASQNIPFDVREAMNTPASKRTPDQISRLSAWQGSTGGKQYQAQQAYMAAAEASRDTRTPEQRQLDQLNVSKLRQELEQPGLDADRKNQLNAQTASTLFNISEQYGLNIKSPEQAANLVNAMGGAIPALEQIMALQEMQTGQNQGPGTQSSAEMKGFTDIVVRMGYEPGDLSVQSDGNIYVGDRPLPQTQQDIILGTAAGKSFYETQKERANAITITNAQM